jgi:aquaporin Z
MLDINPLTAYLLLTEFRQLNAGDWIIQNDANSSVGRAVIAIAGARGIRTVSVVHSLDLFDEIKALGGDIVLVDGLDLPERITEASDKAKIELALDAVGGSATQRLLASIEPYGTVVLYSVKNAEPLSVDGPHLVFNSQRIQGFWAVNWLRSQTTFDKLAAIYDELAPMVAAGVISSTVAGEFGLKQYREALAVAAKDRGKEISEPGPHTGSHLAMSDSISTHRQAHHERCPDAPAHASVAPNPMEPAETSMSIRSALGAHWPEYLIEGWALGSFMISVGLFVTLFESPKSLVFAVVPNGHLRIALLGIAIGTTAILLIHSPWGKRSGAHMNPAITLAFLRLSKIHVWDALFFIVAQTLGGALGVVIVAMCLGSPFADPPVSYAVTVPGSAGAAAAFGAETVISFLLMTAVLALTASPALIRFTGLSVGCLVTLFIIVESPVSGTSMNPARTLASAAPGMMWQYLWIYLLAPTVGMLAAAEFRLLMRGRGPPGCTKLLQSRGVRCIHCGYCPTPKTVGRILLPATPDALPCMRATTSPFRSQVRP